MALLPPVATVETSSARDKPPLPLPRMKAPRMKTGSRKPTSMSLNSFPLYAFLFCLHPWGFHPWGIFFLAGVIGGEDERTRGQAALDTYGNRRYLPPPI